MMTDGGRWTAPWEALTKAIFVALCLMAACVTPSRAQTIPPVISPLTVESDHNGVNITTGLITLHGPIISIPAAPRLTFDVVQNAAPYYADTASTSGTRTDSASIHYGGAVSESFRCVDFDCTAVNGNGSISGSGSTLTQRANGGLASYQRAPGGEAYNFSLLATSSCAANTCHYLSYASIVTYPDGEQLTYTYDTAVLGASKYYRPNKVSSNIGYFLTITYQSSDFNSSLWYLPSVVGIYSTANPGTPLQQLTYGANGAITDIAGRVWTCVICQGAVGGTLETYAGSEQLPTESTIARQVTVFNSTLVNLVGTVTNDGVPWSYNYQNVAVSGPMNVYSGITVTGPNGYNEFYTISPGVDVNNVFKPNQITQITDSLSRVTAFQYDSNLRVTKITYPELDSVQVSYDLNGNLIQKITHAKPGSGLADKTETAAYPAPSTCLGVLCYRALKHVDALGRETDYAYNANGQLLEEIDPADATGIHNVLFIDYDSSGPISRKRVEHQCGLANPPPKNQPGGGTPTNPCTLSSEFHTEYDYLGSTSLPSVERRVDEASGVTLTTNYSYDASGHLVQVTGPLAGSDKQYGYDAVGRKIWEMDPQDASGYRVAKIYTYRAADDKVTAVQTGTVTGSNIANFSVTSRADTSYDSLRNPVRTATSSAGTTYEDIDSAFDQRGRKVCDTVRMNAAAFGSLPASACTLGTQGSLGPDRITYNTYDADNQLLSIQKAYGTSLQQTYAAYSYSPNGKQTSVTDADGNYATMTYDGFDRLSVWTFPSMTTHGQVNSADYEQYGYDAEDNRTSLRKRDGRAFTFTYDARNRVITKAVPAGCAPIQAGPCPPASATRSIYYGYDIRGLQLYARFDSASGDGVTNAYDGFGRPTSTTTSIGGLGGAISATYDADGNRTQVLHPDGAHFDSTFDAADRFQYANVTPVGSSGSYRLLTYAYDALGRPTMINPASSFRANAYDPVSRLSSLSWTFAGGVGNVTSTLGYNPASQIVSDQHSNSAFVWQGAVAGTTSYAVNGLNQYTSVGAAAFGYDADGDLISDGHSTYGYDAENRLISATGAANATLTYDPLGRLWQTTGPSTGTTTFLHDGDQIAIEYNGAGALLRRYMWGPGVDSPAVWDEGGALNCTGTHALSADRQGSIVATADCYGNQQAINTYDPYGAPAAGNVGRFQYTGQAWIPELGMYYYKARIYAPSLGRFMQTDPVGYKDQVNLYAYVGNDPMNNADPTGEWLYPWESPFTVNGGSAAQRARYYQAFRNDIGTPRGRQIYEAIIEGGPNHGSPQTLILTPGSNEADGANVGGYGDTIGISHIDPSATFYYMTEKGEMVADHERLVAHEVLGHGAADTKDDGRGRMNNITENENPIMTSQGEPKRTAYSSPAGSATAGEGHFNDNGPGSLQAVRVNPNGSVTGTYSPPTGSRVPTQKTIGP